MGINDLPNFRRTVKRFTVKPLASLEFNVNDLQRLSIFLRNRLATHLCKHLCNTAMKNSWRQSRSG